MPEGIEPAELEEEHHGLKLRSDEELLAELGYKQELNRSWSGFSNFAISFSIISILAGCFTTFSSGWNGGGPAAIAWGWPILAALILCIGLCLAELVSAYPTSGGIYWWASKLGGAKAGYYTGWLNLIGLLAIVASVAYGCATFLDLTLGFFTTSWHSGSLNTIFLFFVAILVIAAVVNIFSSHLLAWINNVSVWWHVFGAAAVVLILVFIPHHHASASMVFTSTVNNTGFFGGKTHGLGFLVVVLPIGALLTQYTITGYDASAHLSEETKSAANACGQGHVAVDLLLRHRWLDPPVGLPLRRPGRVQGHRGRWRGGHHLRPGPHLALGCHGPPHLDRGPVLLHHGLHDQLLPDALRLQP